MGLGGEADRETVPGVCKVALSQSLVFRLPIDYLGLGFSSGLRV